LLYIVFSWVILHSRKIINVHSIYRYPARYLLLHYLYSGRINQVQPQGRKRVVKDKLHEKGLKASSRDFGAQRFRWFSLSLSLSLSLSPFCSPSRFELLGKRRKWYTGIICWTVIKASFTQNGVTKAKWRVFVQRACVTRTGLMEDRLVTVAACLNEMTRGSPDACGLKMQFLSDSSGNWMPQSSPPYPLMQNPLTFPTYLFHRRRDRFLLVYDIHLQPIRDLAIRKKHRGKREDWNATDGPFCVSFSLYFHGNNDDALRCTLFHRVCFHILERWWGGEVSLKINV